MSEAARFWIADGLVVVGLITITLAVFGMTRQEDIYNQIHSASQAVFLGVFPFALAAALGSWEVLGKLAAIGFFLLITTPASSHALAWSAYLITNRRKAEKGLDE